MFDTLPEDLFYKVIDDLSIREIYILKSTSRSLASKLVNYDYSKKLYSQLVMFHIKLEEFISRYSDDEFSPTDAIENNYFNMLIYYFEHEFTLFTAAGRLDAYIQFLLRSYTGIDGYKGLKFCYNLFKKVKPTAVRRSQMLSLCTHMQAEYKDLMTWMSKTYKNGIKSRLLAIDKISKELRRTRTVKDTSPEFIPCLDPEVIKVFHEIRTSDMIHYILSFNQLNGEAYRQYLLAAIEQLKLY